MEEASVSIRLNPFKGLAGPEGTPVPWSPYGRMLSERPVFTLDPLFHAGCYYVQDSSAMFVGYVFRKLLDKQTDIKVLDLCAAPGGKTTDLAASLRERYGDGFTLVANEVMNKNSRLRKFPFRLRGCFLSGLQLGGEPAVRLGIEAEGICSV